MKNFFTLLLFAALALNLQYSFWFGKNSVATLSDTREQIEREISHNKQLTQRNNVLKAEVVDLKYGEDVMEQRARVELGYIEKGETFYRIVEVDQLPADLVEPSVR